MYTSVTQFVRIWYTSVCNWFASGTHLVRVPLYGTHHAYHALTERLADLARPCPALKFHGLQEQVSLAESFKFRRFRTAVLCLLLQGRVQHSESLAGEHRLPTRPDALTAAVLQKYQSPGHQWLLFAQERRVSNV